MKRNVNEIIMDMTYCAYGVTNMASATIDPKYWTYGNSQATFRRTEFRQA